LIGQDTLRYPVIMQGIPGRGHEAAAAKAMIRQLPQQLGLATPELLLYDGLACTRPLFQTARAQNIHLLVKCRNPEFREVFRDAQALFNQPNTSDFQVRQGFDSHRLCNWKIKVTQDSFAGVPVTIAHLTEEYVKRPERPLEEAWIITTDTSLFPGEIREAAHLRWSIENDGFKKLSTLAGTKRFHFKDPQPFLVMLRIICFSIAAFELVQYILQQKKQIFQRFLGGVKPTIPNIFILLAEHLGDQVFWV
jgi:hypothetical protein